MAINPRTPPWYFGNTTVRSPFRLRDGLVALSTSSLQGNLHGREQEIAFRNLLGEHGIVELGDDATYSVSRKWRAALSQLGFLYPDIPASDGVNQSDLGPVDTITPNGWRLIRAETVAGMQECFLRSMASYFIPNFQDKDYRFTKVFSPLRHTLAIMLELERQTGDSRLVFLELGLIVQMSNAEQGIDSIVGRIVDFRTRREAAKNKRQFDNHERDYAGDLYGYVPGTFNDYADTNFRYLKATGLVQTKGRGITLVPEKHLFIEQLVADTGTPENNLAMLMNLCNGATLPTDNQATAKIVLDDLVRQLNRRGIPFDLAGRPVVETGDINVIRHEVEDQLFALNELDFADRQAQQWEEIAAWMDLLIANRNRSHTLPSGEEIKVPAGEAPAYFEWIVWRAFLAIDSLHNKPNEARKFKIDQDFLPVGTAPGGGPDLLFEFEDFVLVVEVTLTTNSRQEAAEGEPVRRHVASAVQSYRGTGKDVYGLFLANTIDSNTAETFRYGVWFLADDQRMHLDIVPLPLAQFKDLFVALFQSKQVDSARVAEVIRLCRGLREHEAPAWKRLIVNEVVSYANSLLQ